MSHPPTPWGNGSLWDLEDCLRSTSQWRGREHSSPKVTWPADHTRPPCVYHREAIRSFHHPHLTPHADLTQHSRAWPAYGSCKMAPNAYVFTLSLTNSQSARIMLNLWKTSRKTKMRALVALTYCIHIDKYCWRRAAEEWSSQHPLGKWSQPASARLKALG